MWGPRYTDSDDYSSYDGSYDDQSDSSPEDCQYCDATYKKRNRQRHLNNVHKCPHCPHYMPKTSIQTHITNKHMVGCSYCDQRVFTADLQQHELSHFVRCRHCDANILKQNITAHINDRHPFQATVGMIRKITDTEFNQLVAANCVYAKDGHIFIKSWND